MASRKIVFDVQIPPTVGGIKVARKQCFYCDLLSRGEHYLWCGHNPDRGVNGYVDPRDGSYGTVIPLGIALTIPHVESMIPVSRLASEPFCCRPTDGVKCYACQRTNKA